MSISVRPRGDTSPSASKDPDQPSLGLSLFNGFDLRDGDFPVPLPRSAERLVAFLALHDRPLQRSYVAGTLWPDTTDDRAGANLRSSVWRLRRTGYSLVEVTATHLELARRVAVDVHELVTLIWRILDPNSEEREADLLAMFAPADLLPGWYEDWIVVERERLRQLRLHALEVLCERLISTRRFGPAVEAGLAAARDEPLRESARRVLIRAHLAEGNLGEAAREYRQYRQLLRDELGLSPSPEMEVLVRDVVLR